MRSWPRRKGGRLNRARSMERHRLGMASFTAWNKVFANRLGHGFLPLEVSVKKRLTFGFLPWVAAAGVCLGGSFARSEDGSVLVGGESAPAASEAAARIEEKTRNYTVMVPEKRSKTVEYTVNVNVPETKTIQYSVKVPYTEQVEEQYTVCVPVTEQRTATYKVNVPYTEERTATYTVNVPYTEQVEEKYTVQVPYTEEMTGYRTVSKRVPVKSTKTVTCRGGHWVTEAKEISANGKYDAAGNPCCPKVVCCRKWVPTCETKEIEVTM
ncbi:MAG: hypothetical protein EBS56_08675, partial [Planctomycetia bacterium]|nr:hypothetical protein [Planctomycetia bacterium]